MKSLTLSVKNFKKCLHFAKLEEKHGVDLGSGYKNNQACAVFIEYIAQAMKETLVNILAKAKFFSIQGDGSTDSANVEDDILNPILRMGGSMYTTSFSLFGVQTGLMLRTCMSVLFGLCHL